LGTLVESQRCPKHILFMISAKITMNYKLTLVVFLQKKKISKSLLKYFFIIDISKPNIFFFLTFNAQFFILENYLIVYLGQYPYCYNLVLFAIIVMLLY